MANKIQIKHGSGVPGGGKLSSFELGYATQTGQLYISTTGSNILGITPSSHSHVWSEVTGKPANNQFPNTAQVIGGSQDLNSYTTPGFYYQNANANAASGSNYPVAEAGTLIVTKDAGTTQMYYHYNGSGIYYRTFYGSTWKAWTNILTPAWASVSGKPTTFTPSSHTHTGTTTTGGSTTHTTAYGTISLGPMNSSYNHIYSSLSKHFYFNNDMYVANGQQVLHAGNWSNYAAAKSHTHSYAAASHTHTQVAGYGVSTTATSANTIPVRDANGYMNLGWINTPSGSVGNVQPYYVYCNNTTSTDNFIRKIPFTNLADRINGYGSAKNSHKHTATLLRSAIQVAANSSITFTDAANHGLYIVSLRWSTDLWLPVTVPADGLKYGHPWVNDLMPFRLSKSGTTLTLKREGGTAQYYMVHGVT